ncbi:MAG TPA: SCO family protein [Solimonas sp.]|nr:SCO family protein [Solimonas sp.]
MTPMPRGRRQLLLIASMFAAPLVASLLLYYKFPQLLPSGRTNYGELIDPARTVPALQLVDADGQPRDSTALQGKWSFVYLAGAECAQPCRDKLHQIRQIRTRLNDKRPRVQRVYVAPDAAALIAARTLLQTEHPDLLFLAPAPSEPAAAREFFTPSDPQAIYLLDPRGNWLMRYPAGAGSAGILKDIKKLLSDSQMG